MRFKTLFILMTWLGAGFAFSAEESAWKSAESASALDSSTDTFGYCSYTPQCYGPAPDGWQNQLMPYSLCVKFHGRSFRAYPAMICQAI